MHVLDLARTRDEIAAFDPGGIPSYRHARTAILELIDRTESPASRDQFVPGHLTASAIVLSPARDAVLLVHHKRLGRWLQPGGHVEATDASLREASQRECLEETGAILDVSFEPVLIGMDVHEIPAARGEPTHLHHDVLFAFVTQSLDKQLSDESHDVVWAQLAEVSRFDPDPPLARTLQRTAEILGAARPGSP